MSRNTNKNLAYSAKCKYEKCKILKCSQQEWLLLRFITFQIILILKFYFRYDVVSNIIFVFGNILLNSSIILDLSFNGLFVRSIDSKFVNDEKSLKSKFSKSLSLKVNVFIAFNLYSDGGNCVNLFTLKSNISTELLRSSLANTRSIRQMQGPPTFSQNKLTHLRSSEADKITFLTIFVCASCNIDFTVGISRREVFLLPLDINLI